MNTRADISNLKNQVVILNENAQDPNGEVLPGTEFRIEDYWDTLTGKSWMYSDGNPAALKYAMRSGMSGLPLDNEVVYGKIGAFGHLVHISEIPV
jgi:hypothetical protein